MASLALGHGVPPDRIVLEPRSANTFQNALYSGAVMAERGWRTAVLVTDPFHMRRALFVFRKLGIPALGISVEGRLGETPWRWYAAYLKEMAALARSAALFAIGRDKAAVQALRRRLGADL